MSKSQDGVGESAGPLSVCLFCGSSNGASPDYVQAAAEFGRILAEDGSRLVYGGGGIGLMGAGAKAAHSAGGKVLGVMPDFLRRHEVIYDEVETQVVSNMHDRKRIMFENSDAFAIFPGGVGTLEEVVELMSWRRLDLHRKPIVFLDLNDFWGPFFAAGCGRRRRPAQVFTAMPSRTRRWRRSFRRVGRPLRRFPDRQRDKSRFGEGR
jgi:uncharacterized protein (TIGR00730 family)